MLVVGLTGGVASGKSEVGTLFGQLGADVLEADSVGHRLLGEEYIRSALVRTFGPEILDPAGTIDRRVLGARAFRNRVSLRKLNAICHPPLLADLRGAISAARRRPPGVFVLVAALLVEWDLHEDMDRVVTVEATAAVRKRRLMRRFGLDERDAQRRVACQIDRHQRVREADYVIDGGSRMQDMLNAARDVWNQLQREALLPVGGSACHGVE